MLARIPPLLGTLFLGAARVAPSRVVIYPGNAEGRRLLTCATGAGDIKSYARPVIAVPTKVVTIAKGNSKGTELCAEEWESKIERYTRFERLTLRPNPKNSPEPQRQRDDEADKLIKSLGPSDYLVLLDERGRQVTSLEMTDILEEASVGAVKTGPSGT